MKHDDKSLRTKYALGFGGFITSVGIVILGLIMAGNYSRTADSGNATASDSFSADVTKESASEISSMASTEVIISEEQYVSTASSEESVAEEFVFPVYDGRPSVVVCNNVPLFAEDDMKPISSENYSPLDSLGRCGVAYACVGTDIMPTEERGEIGPVKPSGWHTVKYNDLIDGNYLYNRCHLIGYQLTGENANECNLITGTRYLNVQGMLPYENEVADYVSRTGNHVLYRVTPHFEGDNLIASGVEMEAYSVEDEGSGVCFHVYCFNVQPMITIDYLTGDSWVQESFTFDSEARTDASTTEQVLLDYSEFDYVLNTNTKKFHRVDCDSVSEMKAKNRKGYSGDREQLIEDGYSPCGRCKP